MPDGSIRINTRIDNSKLNEDLKETTKNIKQIENDIDRNANNVGKMTAKYNETNQKIKENESLLRNIINDTRTIVETDGQIVRMSDEDARKMLATNTQYQSLLSKTAELYNNAEQYKNKIVEGNRNIRELRNELDKAKTQQESYKKKVEETKNKQKQLNYTTDGISKSLNKGITKVLRYAGALISIRSIYGLLSNTMNSWLNGNSKGAKQLKADVDYMKNAIGRALSPVLQYIVKLLYQALGFTGALIKAFTGVDIFAGSVADYMKSTTSSASKTNRELKKQLASFDRINKLNDNNSNQSSSGGGVTPSQDLSGIMEGYTEIAEKIKAKFDEIKDLIPIIGAGILAWKLSDLFFSQLKGLDALKAKIGLTLLITGLAVWYDGIKQFKNGEITGKSLLEMVGGAIGAGVGLGMLTSSVTLGLTLGLVLLSIGMIEGGKQTLTGKIASMLGLSAGAKDTIYVLAFNFELSAKVLGYENLIDAIASNMKEILKRVADYVEKIPFIGKSIANGIRSAIKESEKDTTKVIKYSTQKSLEDANSWVKGISETNGKETRQSYQKGYSSLTNQTTDVISNSQNTAIQNASVKVNREAYKAGQSEGQSINSGIGSESLEEGTSRLLNTGKSTLNNCTMFVEGQRVGTTAKEGYSSTDISRSTLAIINGAKTVLNNSSLSLEGNRLAKTADNGFSDVNFNNTGRNSVNEIAKGISDESWKVTNESKKIAREANSSLNNNMNGFSSGANLVTGIVNGINNNKLKVTNTIKGLANGAVLAFNAALGIHSPSRVMADQAKFIPLGIAEGVDSTSDKAIGSMKDLVFGMQETVDGMDYSNITQIPKLSRNAITYIPKQAISTNEIQRTIVGQDNNMINKILSMMQSNSKGKTSLTIPFIIDGEEWFKKTIELNEAYNLATNGGGL